MVCCTAPVTALQKSAKETAAQAEAKNILKKFHGGTLHTRQPAPRNGSEYYYFTLNDRGFTISRTHADLANVQQAAAHSYCSLEYSTNPRDTLPQPVASSHLYIHCGHQ